MCRSALHARRIDIPVRPLAELRGKEVDERQRLWRHERAARVHGPDRHGLRERIESSSMVTSSPLAISGATLHVDFSTMPPPAASSSRIISPLSVTSRPDTRTSITPVGVTKVQSRWSARITHSCCARSAGWRGVLCSARYAGDAHSTRRLLASFFATSVESFSAPMWIARSMPSSMRSTI